MPYNKSKDRKPTLLQHYLQLVKKKAPHVALGWEASDKAVSEFPPPTRLNMSKIRVLLSLHAVPHDHATTRASLVEIYNTFRANQCIDELIAGRTPGQVQANELSESSEAESSESSEASNEYLGKHP